MTNKETGTSIEKRRSKRVSAPKQATALFKNDIGGLDRIQIRDLSLDGMLICDNSKGKRYSTASEIKNLYLNIYVGDLNTGNKFFIFIDNGRIVRSFVDEATQTRFYGIEFSYSSSYTKDQFENLISRLPPDSLH
jgi:c-di-GMP-binding flagellar brake protein YcgR